MGVVLMKIYQKFQAKMSLMFEKENNLLIKII